MISPSEPLNQLTTEYEVDKAIVHERAREAPRGHLGLSELGEPDIRTTWLKFRWSLPDELEPRSLRIFRLGDMIEQELIRLLKLIPGAQVWDRDPDTRQQWRVSLFGGHCGGSMDGKMTGVPEAPKTEHVLEFKSAKNSEFNKAKKVGIEQWKPTYYGQVQGYMGAQKLTRCLFGVYNKDTSAIYWERIKYDPDVWQKLQIDAQHILEMHEPPVSRYGNPNHYEIKNFRSQNWQDIYWGKKLPLPNCRNCKHSMIMMDGDAHWACGRHGHLLSLQEQEDGCDNHLYIPAMLQKLATVLQDDDDLPGIVRYQTNDEVEFWNAEDVSPYPGAMVFASIEICALSQNVGLNREYLSDPALHKLRTVTGGSFQPNP